MTFAESLKRIRTERGLSQQQLSEMLYVDRSSIARWETGSRTPDALMITRLSKCLGVDVATLLANADDPREIPNVIIVDDERIILSGGMPVLEEAMPHASITGFIRPSEAISFAEVNRVDIAFLDIELGSQSGFDLSEKLLEINPNINIIFLTAYSNYALDAWKTKASGFLVKPLAIEDVKDTIQRLRYPVPGL